MDRSILVLYGSETGNAQDMAEELGRICQRLHFHCHIEELDAVELSALLRYQLVMFVVATTGQGDMPHNSLLFWKKLLRKRLPPGCLAQLKYTCFGLGDSTYVKFNWAARKLIRRLEQLGAQTFVENYEADEQFPDGVEGCFATWADGLRKHLLDTYPHPEGLEPLSEEDILPPRWSLEAALEKTTTADINPPSPPHVPNPPSTDLPPDTLLPIPNSWDATIAGNDRMTPTTHWQDVRLVKFDIPSRSPTEKLSVNPGDCLTIYPKNFPADAQRLITLMGWEDVADKPLDLSACGPLPRGLHAPPISTVRNLLIHSVDITAIPRRSFLRSMSYFSDDPEHRERLLEFTKTEYLDEYFNYATRSRRSILEVLEEFTSVRIPVQRLLDIFPLIRGRDFSIANGGERLRHPSRRDVVRVELLIALVKYRTILRKPRVGLCSRYLEALPPNSLIRVTHKPVLSPIHGGANAQRPLVAMATGTGIAPVRCLVHERLSHPSPAPMTIFFGNRNREADYLFENEWSELADSVQVRTAFSRDQVHKIYVQDLVRQEAGQMEQFIQQNAIFAVCGGSSKMADACKGAVFDPFIEKGDKEGQRRILEALTWWQEIW
ncbi:sulfite reductase flavoprotein alpha-component [Stachybotrys elegans]|uniref:NADPH-dependent diflavin oxidoreductase 1 n=1 Tax=Stachybotrys elegans TaxID=80388 RepID=A0A8K0T250_9HYPO|nr:sulfite reductase flavoprotein alpha-component [Stachybotrys elegans]